MRWLTLLYLVRKVKLKTLHLLPIFAYLFYVIEWNCQFSSINLYWTSNQYGFSWEILLLSLMVCCFGFLDLSSSLILSRQNLKWIDCWMRRGGQRNEENPRLTNRDADVRGCLYHFGWVCWALGNLKWNKTNFTNEFPHLMMIFDRGINCGPMKWESLTFSLKRGRFN